MSIVRVSHVNELGVLEKSENFQIFRLNLVALVDKFNIKYVVDLPYDVFWGRVKSAKTSNSMKSSREKPYRLSRRVSNASNASVLHQTRK